MNDIISELADIESRALEVHARCNTKSIKSSIKKFIDAANKVELAHSGSWIGYHSHVYYNGLKRPPAEAFFDRQWGLNDRFSSATSGDWVRYSYSDIYDHLAETNSKPSFDELNDLMKDVLSELEDIREELVLTIEACRTAGSDEYLDRMKDSATKARMRSPDSIVKSNAPTNFMTNDHTAAAGGIPVPPHVAFRAYIQSIISLFDSAEEIAKVAKRTSTYLTKRTKATAMLKNNPSGTRVFIGHGRSDAWLELKNYIQDRLELKCDDFNRETVAGKTTVARLSKMLDEACFAFLILTAEDEKVDGTLVARMNVVHELGLFQGRLGFEKAIVMLESGCEEFSNIQGLTHIPFDKGKIKAAFHEVVDTLKREKIIP